MGLTDQEAAKLQYFIDGPASLLGPSHRSVNHSFRDMIPFFLVHGTKFMPAWYSHILLDEAASKDPKLKLMLEFWAAWQKMQGPQRPRR